MNRRTIAALNRINQSFYRRRGEEFSRTRRTAWPGWRRLVSAVDGRRSAAESADRVSILDVGCGNGRLLPFLEEHLQSPISYLGVDSSLPMLLEAGLSAVDSGSTGTALVAADVVCEPALGLFRSERFDLAVAFGLLHHIPARQARLRLLSAIGHTLRPGGILAVSFWQFGEHDRFRRRSVSWEAYNRRAVEPIDVTELEEGDMLLVWGESSSGAVADSDSIVRYCHYTDAAAADDLVASMPFEVLSRYRSDGEGGHLNLYFLLEKTA